MRSLLLLSLPFVVTSALACTLEPQPIPMAPAPPPVEASAFMNAYADAICNRAAKCFPVASYLDPTCRAETRKFFGEDVEAAIAAGRIVYDTDAAGACVAGLEALDCLAEHPSDPTLAACYEALTGTVQKDQPCFGTFECAEGLCYSTTGDACPTVCQAVAKKGEACSLLSGPYCDEREGLRCSQGTCVVPASKGGACLDNFGCTSGTVCVGNECVPLRKTGYGCAKDSSCASGNFCAAGGDEGGLCEERVPEGGACSQDAGDNNAAFRRVQCQDGLVCLGGGLTSAGATVTGTCAKAMDEGGGCTVEPSGYQLFDTGCRDGLVCVAGVCQKPPAVGEACAPHLECQQDVAYCDFMSMQCSAPKANGEACDIDRECAGGYCGGMSLCTDAVTYCGP